MPQEKLPVETVNLRATLTKTQTDEILKWYFRNFLNKDVTYIDYSISSSGILHSVRVDCTERTVPIPARTVEEIKVATKPTSIVID